VRVAEEASAQLRALMQSIANKEMQENKAKAAEILAR
jgi:hypothetical protein